MIFRDRIEAAHQLAKHLKPLHLEDPLVLAVPRGAVPMGKVIAEELQGELDIILVHKFGFPDHPEFALGSVTEDGAIFLGMGAERYHLSEKDIEDSAFKEIKRLKRKRHLYTPDRSSIDVRGRTIVIVDDGIATGATMTAAIRALQSAGASRILIAAPVATGEAIERLRKEGAEVHVLKVPELFLSVGQFFEDFSQVEDNEVVEILTGTQQGESKAPSPEETKSISIHEDGLHLKGILNMPARAVGLVIFAHGSGSGRHSPRNQAVAAYLNRFHLGTLLIDLLEEDEASNRAKVFDIDLLAERMRIITHWARQKFQHLPIGYFGASTGAAAALQAAAQEKVAAIVCRGGRPDLAIPYLKDVDAPTLLLVGSNDFGVIELNEQAYEKMTCEKNMTLIPGASHLFEEPGTLEAVSDLSQQWFVKYFMTSHFAAETDENLGETTSY